MEYNNTSVFVSESRIKGSTALPYPYPIVFLLLFSITGVLSVVGNVLVVIVLVVQKRLTKGVRYLLVNLAVADFFMAVLYIPFTCINNVFGNWFLSTTICKIDMFALDTLQVASVLTLTVIGIDRYFAILYPLKFHWLRSDRAIISVLIIIWMVGISDCIMLLFYSQKFIQYLNGIEDYRCDYDFPTESSNFGYIISNFLITYPIPIVILVFAYSSIAWKLFHRNSPGNADSERDLHQRQNTIKVIKMLILIVVVFILCWSPIQGFFVVSLSMPNIMARDSTNLRITFVWVAWIGMTNCFANPFIYCFSNDKFWKDLKIVFNKLISVGKNQRGQLKYQSSSDSFATTTSKLSL